MALASREIRATTLRIPTAVYEEAKHFVDTEGAGIAAYGSLNDFFVTAIQAYIRLHARRQIDAEFTMMGEDPNYQKEATSLAAEFDQSDWDSLVLIERHEKESSRAASATR